MRILIRGGRVIDPSSGHDGIADVLVEDERISQVGQGLEAPGARLVDASGLVVAPGFVDMHVHFREPGEEYKEDIASGSQAAAAGGFTSVACMPNTNPPVDNEALVVRILRLGGSAGRCRVYPVAAVTKGRRGEELTEMMALREAGCVGFSDDGSPVANARVMRRALEYARLTGLPVISHCEERTLSEGGHMHEGAVSTRLGVEGIPTAAEDVAVARDVRLAEICRGRLHVCHVSSARSVEILRRAKDRGLRVSAEVTPHHVALTEAAVEGFDPNTKMNPPLRAEEDRAALVDGLVDGTLDVIATDHAPHAPREKLVEFDAAPFGVIGLETALAVCIGALVKPGHLDLATLVERMSLAPARILGLEAGSLRPGAEADVVVFDPAEEWVFSEERVFSRSRNSPFLGCKLTGRVHLTLLGGRATYESVELRRRIAVAQRGERASAAMESTSP